MLEEGFAGLMRQALRWHRSNIKAQTLKKACELWKAPRPGEPREECASAIARSSGTNRRAGAAAGRGQGHHRRRQVDAEARIAAVTQFIFEILGVAPIDYSPILLLKPFGFPDRSGHPAAWRTGGLSSSPRSLRHIEICSKRDS